MLDKHQARRLITALTGSPSSPVTFQAYYDPKKEFGPTPEGVYPEVWTATLDESVDFIEVPSYPASLCKRHNAI